MEAARWLHGLWSLMVLAALASLGLGGPAAPGVAGTSWEPPPCPDPAGTPDAPGMATGAWYRLSPVLDATGTLAGQRLTVGIPGAVPREADLPPESFAAGPRGGLLVIGDDDGSRSRVRVVDLERDCVRREDLEPAVVRSAILAPDLGSVWEHHVDRATRADLGVWRRLPGHGPVRKLPGLAPDPVHGPTFATDLRWTTGRQLIVASCGALVCRTRILDPVAGWVASVDGTGPALGLSDGRLVAYAACQSVECPVIAVDPATGTRSTLADAAGPAELGGPDDGSLVYTLADGELATVDVATGRRTAPAVGPGLAPVRRGSSASAGADLAPGVLLLAPAGWFTRPADAATIDPASEIIEPLEEVQP